MEILTLKNKIEAPVCFALGFFDAVHIGHQKVIKAAVDYALENGIKSAVFTFSDKDGMLSKKSGSGYIYSEKKRQEIFTSLGVDYVVMPDFKDINELSPKDFVELLCKRYNAKAFFCGEDFTFGKNAEGNSKLLSKMAESFGAKAFIIKQISFENKKVSSTYIKELLKRGDVKKVKALLNREYSFIGKVVDGKKIGSKQLYPTINLNIPENEILLKFGVYASLCKVNDKIYPAVTNIGVRPTVNASEKGASVETYILNENLNLYNKEAEIFFLSFLRDEKKFPSVSELKEQISKDIILSQNEYDIFIKRQG
ncbi:MAG: bifunctional riboflavin kinase/FAD synthetase [Oscillospiraceae bacterium]|nr:bifunctional riboflavin kinase/FAD synthetase [Oscillospiraceae bacterium]